MADTRGIIIDEVIDPCFNAKHLTIRTYGEIHLFLHWSLYPPKKIPRYITVRGVRSPCGFNYRLTDSNCIEQTEAGDTFLHTFIMPPEAYEQCLYYFLSTSCTLGGGAFQSILRTTCLDPCEAGIAAWEATSIFAANVPKLPGFGGISWTHAAYDPDNCLPPLPTATLQTCGPGKFDIRLNFSFRNNPLLPGTDTAYVRLQVGASFDHIVAIFTLNTDEFAFGSSLNTVEVTSPAGAIIIPSATSDNGRIQFTGANGGHWISCSPSY